VTPAATASTASQGITSQEATLIAPVAPALLIAEVVPGGVRLSWAATGEDLTGYVCLRRGATTAQWTLIGNVAASQTSMLDRQPPAGSYVYAVQAIAVNGKSSPLTESAAVDVPR
jgi:hypothetical protein